MEALSEFLAMGGYAQFVWPAYLIAAAVMAGIAVESRRQLRAAEAALAALETPAPETPAPETPAPETSAPETSVGGPSGP